LKLPKIPQQIISLFILLLVVLTGFLFARKYFTPPSFGLYGHYRANAVDEIKARGMKYAGSESCIECHDDIYNLKAKGYHKNVACEICHGPAGKHADDPSETSPEIPHDRSKCTICHDYNLARPTGFPQIIANQHNPGKFCTQCHQAHNPTLPHTPNECGACHREIASQKMVSHHASLECTTCHEAPLEHLTDPRSFEVKKPMTKEFCGQCHARDANSPVEIPRIDLQIHGGRYLCWDCHYPHNPEANR
jgi:hypothetical protein